MGEVVQYKDGSWPWGRVIEWLGVAGIKQHLFTRCEFLAPLQLPVCYHVVMVLIVFEFRLFEFVHNAVNDFLDLLLSGCDMDIGLLDTDMIPEMFL